MSYFMRRFFYALCQPHLDRSINLWLTCIAYER